MCKRSEIIADKIHYRGKIHWRIKQRKSSRHRKNKLNWDFESVMNWTSCTSYRKIRRGFYNNEIILSRAKTILRQLELCWFDIGHDIHNTVWCFWPLVVPEMPLRRAQLDSRMKWMNMCCWSELWLKWIKATTYVIRGKWQLKLYNELILLIKLITNIAIKK